MKTKLSIDRSLIDDRPIDPRMVAEVIHAQLPTRTVRVDVEAVAHAVDITDIIYTPVRNLDGALVTTDTRDTGQILINSHLRHHRRRFTLGHELGHFLLVRHGGEGVVRFDCKASDMSETDINGRLSVHQRQEREANRFAIELLAPRTMSGEMINEAQDLTSVITMSRAFDISKLAAARRLIDLTSRQIAIAITHNGVIEYWIKSSDMPTLNPTPGSILPLPYDPTVQRMTRVTECDYRPWLPVPKGRGVTLQSIAQNEGYGMTLVEIIA